MKQFILNNGPDKDGLVRLDGNDYHYLVRVRRLAVGEFFPALLPDGEELLIQVTSIKNGTLTGKCSSPSSAPRFCESGSEKIPPLILFQAMPKGDKMDLIVRQAAEGGIAEIVPFVSEFSVAKGAEGQKFSRWERLIKEARQQSGSSAATSLRGTLTKTELFDYWNDLREKGALGILFHHEGLDNMSLHGYLEVNPKIVVLVIGPEGGFSDIEVSLFEERGFKPLKIGDTVLRTETAALYCAAAIKIILLERNTWELTKKS